MVDGRFYSYKLEGDKSFMINQCCICGQKVRTLHQLRFKDIVGMASEYTQYIGYCDLCDFVFTQNPFSEQQLTNRYTNFSKFEYDAKNYIGGDDEGYKRRSVHQKQFIYQNCSDIKSVLDIGASSGYNLSLYLEEGCTVLGIEPSPLNCELAEKKYQVNMFTGVFADYYEKYSSNNQLDLIILSHVLEHIVNPLDIISKCREINQKYIYIEVPTFDYKSVNEPYGMFADEHVNYFTLQSLNKLMTSAGYTLINAEILLEPDSCLPAGYPALSTIWRVTAQGDDLRTFCPANLVIDRYLQDSEVELNRVRDVIRAIPSNKRLAVWGTGHHASMLLANTDLLCKNIIKFYDSDTRKYSFQMGGKPIVPFCGEDIENGEIEAVLIATFTAQKPILKILQPYQNLCEVICLY